MIMGRFLFPDEYYDSTYSINFKKYYRHGYRAVLFDIDNTLVMHDFPSDPRCLDLIRRIKKTGLKICVISNNDEERVKSFADSVGIEYIFKAGKPLAKGYTMGMKKLGTDTETTIFVGDQLFTDIWGANNAGIHSILVKPIDKHEEIQIILKRRLEAPLIWMYLLKHKMKTKK